MEDAIKFLLKDKISEFKDLLEEEDEVKTIEERKEEAEKYLDALEKTSAM